MFADAVKIGDRAGSAAELPVPVDLADEWLVDALVRLLDACELPKAALHRFLEQTGRPALLLARAPTPSDDPIGRRKRLDAARLAVLLAALAVEARLNRVLKLRDPGGWSTIAHLSPVDKLRLAPGLPRDAQSVPTQTEVADLACELFELRAELVDAGVRPAAALEAADRPDPRFMPDRAGATVEASAKICVFLATLANREDETRIARLVQHAAKTLDRRARACSVMRGPIAPRGWSLDADFPPDIVGS